MKKVIITLLILYSLSLCGYICWEDSGALVHSSNNLSWDQGALALSDGNFLLVWSDAVSGWQQMKAMKVSAAGENIWSEAVLLKSNFCRYPICLESQEVAGGIIISWFDGGEIIIQKLDLSGTKLWGEDGVSIETTGYDQNDRIWIIEGENGKAYIAWDIFNWPQELYGVCLDGEGNFCPGWLETGNILMTSNSEMSFQVISDGYGGLVVCYFGYSYAVFQRYQENGEYLWGEDGVQHSFNFGNIWIYMNAPGEYHLFYKYDEQLYIMGVDENGELLFEAPEYLFSFPDVAGYKYDLDKTSDGNYAIVWQEGNLIKAQKVEMGGNPLWDTGGVVIGNDYTNYTLFFATPDNSGGIYISWDHEEIYNNSYTFQWVNSAGETPIGEYGYEVSVNDCSFYKKCICVQDDDSAGFFWFSEEDEEDEIRMQMVSNAGELLLEQEGRELYSQCNLPCYPQEIFCSEHYTAVAWALFISGRREVRCQILENENGDRLLPDYGLVVLSDNSLKYSACNIAFDEEAEILYIAFNVSTQDNLATNFGIQAIDLQGNRLYGDAGLLMGDWNDDYEHELLFKQEVDGMRLLWNELCPEVTENSVWAMQKLDAQGFVWGDSVILCGATLSGSPRVVLSGDYLVWKFGERIRVVKFNAMGEIDPSWNGDYLQTAQMDNLNGLHVRNTGSGIIIIGESTNLGIYNYYGYLFSDQGEYLWGNEGRHILEIDAYPSICLYDDCFYMERSGEWSYQRILERYDYEGEMLWNDSVMWLENGDALGTKMLMRDDKIIIYSALSLDWTSGRKIFLKGYYPDGSPITGIPTEGLIICDEYAGQGLIEVKTSEAGKNVVLWEDSRNIVYNSAHKSIYAQKIDFTTLNEDDNEVISPVIINNYPNPFKEGTWFKVMEPGFRETGTIEIFNIKGQRVRKLKIENVTGKINSVVWDGTNEKQEKVSSGIYLYRLRNGDVERISGKMMLIR